MGTTSLPGLEAYLKELGLGPIPLFAAADFLNSPLDIYHSYLAESFLPLVECGPDIIYNAIQPPGSIGDGDLDIVVPRLKLPGVNPKELALELLKKV
jgi:arginyl-tRNA synthetase